MSHRYHQPVHHPLNLLHLFHRKRFKHLHLKQHMIHLKLFLTQMRRKPFMLIAFRNIVKEYLFQIIFNIALPQIDRQIIVLRLIGLRAIKIGDRVTNLLINGHLPKILGPFLIVTIGKGVVITVKV